MATYSINGTSLSNYGAIASPSQAQTLALTGIFDFPKRDGETEHDWGNEIEAFLSAEDIEFQPKNCSLRIYIKGANKSEYEANLSNLLTALTNIENLQSSYWLNINNLMATKEIKVTEYINSYSAIVEAAFIAKNGVLNGSLDSPSGGSGFLLDGYNFMVDLGLLVQKRENNKNIPAYKDVETTDEYETPVTYRKGRDITIHVTMFSDNLVNFLLQMGALHQLLASENAKTLTFPDGSTAQVYCKDGFKINTVYTAGGNVYAPFYLKLREI